MPKRAWPPNPALCGVTPIRRLAGFLQHHTNTPQPSIIAGDESPRRSIAACFAMPNTHAPSRTVFSGLTWSASRRGDHWPASFPVVARLISTVALCALHWPQQAGLERGAWQMPDWILHGRLFQPSGVWQRKGWRMSGYSPQSDRRAKLRWLYISIREHRQWGRGSRHIPPTPPDCRSHPSHFQDGSNGKGKRRRQRKGRAGMFAGWADRPWTKSGTSTSHSSPGRRTTPHHTTAATRPWPVSSSDVWRVDDPQACLLHAVARPFQGNLLEPGLSDASRRNHDMGSTPLPHPGPFPPFHALRLAAIRMPGQFSGSRKCNHGIFPRLSAPLGAAPSQDIVKGARNAAARPRPRS